MDSSQLHAHFYIFSIFFDLNYLYFLKTIILLNLIKYNAKEQYMLILALLHLLFINLRKNQTFLKYFSFDEYYKQP